MVQRLERDVALNGVAASVFGSGTIAITDLTQYQKPRKTSTQKCSLNGGETSIDWQWRWLIRRIITYTKINIDKFQYLEWYLQNPNCTSQLNARN